MEWPSILQEIPSAVSDTAFVVQYGVEPKSLTYILKTTTGNDKVTAQKWLEEVTSAKDEPNPKAISILDD